MTDKQRYDLLLSIKERYNELKQEKENDEKVIEIGQKQTVEFYEFLLGEIFKQINIFEKDFENHIGLKPISDFDEETIGEDLYYMLILYNDRNKNNQIWMGYIGSKRVYVFPNLLAALLKEDNIEMQFNEEAKYYVASTYIDNLFDIAQQEYELYYRDMIYKLKEAAGLANDLEEKDIISKRIDKIWRKPFMDELFDIIEKILISVGEDKNNHYALENYPEAVLAEIQSIEENYLGQTLKRQITALEKYKDY